MGHQGFAVAPNVDLQVSAALVGRDHDQHAKGSSGSRQRLCLSAWYGC